MPFRIPGLRFRGYRIKAFRRAATSLLAGGWMLVTAFRSPATAAAFTASIPESTFLACYFASAPLDSAARSVFGSATDPQFAPRPAASTPQTRYSFLDQLDLPHPRPPLPLRTVTSLRIKAFCRTCRSSTRLPISPDLRSLPAAVSIASYDCGSTFPVRYVLGGLLFPSRVTGGAAESRSRTSGTSDSQLNVSLAAP